ncbi:MAG: cysteine--tRNA ligase [Candidatus Komeilibacteria bacterium CG10_big_fil_rev_8_21_14_0_10_36_65]|nr:MAG: cysteine--tRNA ligase [Candidatus Komeilibacteria bacterium CG10_big_fil_rev_8_21_14_0_10_36_65]
MKKTNLILYDSATRKKRIFVPADKSRVTMYVCGPTVYSYAHIGNFRPAVVFDILFRVLRHRYGAESVVYARNITDIDDKIIRASQETGEPIESITAKFSAVYHEESAELNVLPPTIEPIATNYIGEMVSMVERLIANGFAYVADGHVLFATKRFDAYGSFSGVDHDEMLAGARVEVASYKQNPADFVLWKPSKSNEPGWESPWGRGRPGWHLECSTMIEKELGRTIDIHGGGQDLRFPHHENEIAQSAGVHDDAPLARYWVHNGFLQMGADKMSKSLGNIVLVRDLLKRWQGEVLRFALLSAQYRKPLEWSNDLLVQSKQQLDRFYRVIEESPDVTPSAPPQNFIDALNDDLNTPVAIAVLHSLRDRIASVKGDNRMEAIASFKAAGQLLGLLTTNPKQWFEGKPLEGLSAEEIEELIRQRTVARERHDFAGADQIRDQLSTHRVVVEDGPTGTTWRRK